MGQVPNGSSFQGASNDMQHDLPRSTFDLDLRSNFEVDLYLYLYLYLTIKTLHDKMAILSAESMLKGERHVKRHSKSTTRNHINVV